MFRSLDRLTFGVLAFGLVHSLTFAASLDVRPTSTPPIIDGVLDDAAWKDAARSEAFRQIYPGEDVDPSERTEIWITYDSATNRCPTLAMTDSKSELARYHFLPQKAAKIHLCGRASPARLSPPREPHPRSDSCALRGQSTVIASRAAAKQSTNFHDAPIRLSWIATNRCAALAMTDSKSELARYHFLPQKAAKIHLCGRASPARLSPPREPHPRSDSCALRGQSFSSLASRPSFV